MPHTAAGVAELTAPLRSRAEWKALETHHAAVRDVHLRELFAAGLVELVFDAVDQRMPACINDVFANAHSSPAALVIGGRDQYEHLRTGRPHPR